jgi:hypothetical protein
MAYAKSEQQSEQGVVDVRFGIASLPYTLEAGAAAGGAGALLMAAWWILQSAATGYDPLFFFRMVGATFQGPEALVGGAGVVLSGLFLHVVCAVAFAVPLAMAVTRKTRLGPSLVGGVVYGLLILLFMTYVVLPYADPMMRQRVVGMPGTWFFSHVVFGLGVGLVPLFKRRFAGRREPDDLRA